QAFSAVSWTQHGESRPRVGVHGFTGPGERAIAVGADRRRVETCRRRREPGNPAHDFSSARARRTLPEPRLPAYQTEDQTGLGSRRRRRSTTQVSRDPAFGGRQFSINLRRCGTPETARSVQPFNDRATATARRSDGSRALAGDDDYGALS